MGISNDVKSWSAIDCILIHKVCSEKTFIKNTFTVIPGIIIPYLHISLKFCFLP